MKLSKKSKKEDVDISFKELLEYIKPKISANYIKWSICAVAVIVVGFGMYGLGSSKNYEAEYVSEKLNERRDEFPEIDEAESANEVKAEKKAELENEIEKLRSELEHLSEEEAKFDTYEAELQALVEQIEELSAQKEEKKQILDGLNAQLAKY